MSDTYGYGAPGMGGGNPRDRIAQALMNVQNPPPGGPAMGMQPGGMPAQPSPMPVSRPLPAGGAMPQAQPAGFGAVGPPASPMGPVGGPYQQGLNLPGITPPGMLPQR